MAKAGTKTARATALEPQRIGAGEFKARCLKLIDEVQRTRKPIVITKRGKPMARLVAYEAKGPQLYGPLKGMATIKGDIISPIEVEWDALR